MMASLRDQYFALNHLCTFHSIACALSQLCALLEYEAGYTFTAVYSFGFWSWVHFHSCVLFWSMKLGTISQQCTHLDFEAAYIFIAVCSNEVWTQGALSELCAARYRRTFRNIPTLKGHFRRGRARPVRCHQSHKKIKFQFQILLWACSLIKRVINMFLESLFFIHRHNGLHFI